MANTVNYNVWPNYSASNVTKAAASTNADKNNLGQDAFLKILVTQLKNQDPTQPLQDKEFIAQMAQFSSLEQLNNLTKEMKLMRESMGNSAGLIGKNVSWTTEDSSGKVVQNSGLVDGIKMKDGLQYVVVKGADVSLDDVYEVSAPSTGTQAP